jgi:hypothetical protein
MFNTSQVVAYHAAMATDIGAGLCALPQVAGLARMPAQLPR